jgi:hypothetical protein
VQQLYLFTLVVIIATQLRFQIWKNLLVLHHVGDVCNRELGWDYVNLCFSASAMI